MLDEGKKALSLNILVVDDEPNIRKTLAYCLEEDGHKVVSAGNAPDAITAAARRSFDMAFVDLRLGQASGLELIPVLLAGSPWLKIVVITAYASIESAVEAMRRGAADYIAKPFTPDQVRLLTRRIARLRELEAQVASLSEDIHRLGPEPSLHSRNAGMQRVIETARRAAASEATLLLRGESGTGKSVFAGAIHQWSARSAKPLGVVSCPAVPAELLESELFGHARGAFTGAVRDNPGRVAACEGGTLLLDEISEMALSLQAKLLRFIQDKEYERLGDATRRQADVRIITATNADLEKRVAEGRFREDLYYRINVISITVPPLRERPEDILPLALEFLEFFKRANHKQFSGFDEEAAAALQAYAWPGNVRELRNALERAVILGGGDKIGRNDLPAIIVPRGGAPVIGDRVPLAVIEELHIRSVIDRTASLQEAAVILGIDPATLWRRRKTFRM